MFLSTTAGAGGNIDLLLFQIENSGRHVKGVLERDEAGVETSGRSFQLRRERELKLAASSRAITVTILQPLQNT